MKIAIIGTVASSIHGFRADMVKQLVKNDHQVYAFFSEYSSQDIAKIKALGAIPIKYDIKRGGLNPLSDIKACYYLFKILRKIKPDLVFSFASKAIIYGTLASKAAGIPHVTGMLEGLGHTFTPHPNGTHLKSQVVKIIQVSLYKIALPLLDELIFLNPDDPKDLLEKYKINAKKVDVLGGIGVDLKKYPYQEPKSHSDRVDFLFIARLIKEKGVFEFVEAAKTVKKKYPKAQFTILGSIDNSNLGALKQEELDNLVATGIINYPGYVDNIQSWIINSHVFVLPSYYREGVPRSTQEAMAIGRPIITTDVPGCRETVIDGYNGFLITKWDYNALADRMIYFIEHPDLIKTMGYASYNIAQQKFDATEVNQRLLGMLGL